MPSKKKCLPPSSNLLGLATLWMSALTTEAGGAGQGAWGTSHAAGMRTTRRQHDTRFDDPVAELVRDFFYAPPRPYSLGGPEPSSIWQESSRKKEDPIPHFDVSEDENGTVHLTMEVPGLSARDVNIELENDHVIRVSGVRTRRKNGYISQTKFDESVRLNSNVDVENLNVSLSSGILTIRVPKKPTKIKKLTVHSEERGILDPPPKSEKGGVPGGSDII